MKGITEETFAKMKALVGDRDPKTVRLAVIHKAECPLRRGGPCRCDPEVVEQKSLLKESKLARRMRRRNAR